MKPDGLQADWALLFAALKDLRSILSVDFGQPILGGGGVRGATQVFPNLSGLGGRIVLTITSYLLPSL